MLKLGNFRWKTRNDVKFGIVKTIIFLLAGYSLSYVDENKTNQNKYRMILYIPAASVQ
jgi:tryptophan-rich sensory protein